MLNDLPLMQYYKLTEKARQLDNKEDKKEILELLKQARQLKQKIGGAYKIKEEINYIDALSAVNKRDEAWKIINEVKIEYYNCAFSMAHLEEKIQSFLEEENRYEQSIIPALCSRLWWVKYYLEMYHDCEAEGKDSSIPNKKLQKLASKSDIEKFIKKLLKPTDLKELKDSLLNLTIARMQKLPEFNEIGFVVEIRNTLSK